MNAGQKAMLALGIEKHLAAEAKKRQGQRNDLRADNIPADPPESGRRQHESREEFLRKKVLIDFDFTEQSLSEIVTRLHRGEEVRLPLRAGPGAPEGNQNARKEKAQAENNVGITNIVSKGGMTAPYIRARLDRDAPELACAVREGRISANAAAIEAGFRRRPTPLETLQRA